MVALWLVPAAADETLPRLMPEELEVALALSAAPEHVRAEAGAYVLRRGGYVEVKAGTNAFACAFTCSMLNTVSANRARS